MSVRILCLGFTILLTNFCWAMEKAETDPGLKIIGEHLRDISRRSQDLHKARETILEKLKENGPEKIGLRTICGDDWFVLLSQSFVLSSEVPVFVPFKKWRKYNCEIFLDEVSAKEAKITVVPDTIPLLGDHELPDATWKAVVWLEAFAEKREQDELRQQAIPKIDKSLEELALCKANLEKEAAVIKLKKGIRDQ